MRKERFYRHVDKDDYLVRATLYLFKHCFSFLYVTDLGKGDAAGKHK